VMRRVAVAAMKYSEGKALMSVQAS
jgi:hypothetical protein